MNGERCRCSTRDRVVDVGHDARYQDEQPVVTTCGGNRPDDVAGQRDFVPRAVHVNRGSFTCDDDRVGQCADRERGVDGRRDGPRQLDALFPVGRPAIEHEPDYVVTRSQILDTVAAGPVGDGRTEFFYEPGAARFDDNTHDGCAERVGHSSSNRGLGEYRGWGAHDQSENHEGLHIALTGRPPGNRQPRTVTGAPFSPPSSRPENPYFY